MEEHIKEDKLKENFVKRVTAELDGLHSEEKKVVLPRFFKCGVGEYGEGDRFLGVVVPETRYGYADF